MEHDCHSLLEVFLFVFCDVILASPLGSSQFSWKTSLPSPAPLVVFHKVFSSVLITLLISLTTILLYHIILWHSITIYLSLSAELLNGENCLYMHLAEHLTMVGIYWMLEEWMKELIHLVSYPTKTSKTQSYLPLQERVMVNKNRRVSSHEILF